MSVSTRLKLVLAFICIAGLVIAFLHLIPDYSDSMEEASIPSLFDNEEVGTGERESLEKIQENREDISAAGTAGNDEESNRDLLSPTGLFISGHVKDKATGNPVKAFDFNLQWIDEKYRRQTSVHETVRDGKGRFFFALEKGGSYRILVRSSGHLREVLQVKVSGEEGLGDLLVELDRGFVVHGKVVEDATGQPVEGALIFSTSSPYAEKTRLLRIRRGEDQCCAYAKTDDEGCFLLSGLMDPSRNPASMRGIFRITAVHPDFAEGIALVNPDGGIKTVIRLKPGRHIYGKAFGDSGEPAEGVMINMSGAEIPTPRPVLTGPNGRYRTPPATPGRVYLSAGPPPGTAQEALGFTDELKWADLESEDLEVNFGPSPELVTWRGTFYDAAGEPVPRGEIVFSPVHDDLSQSSTMYNVSGSAMSNEYGRFEVQKLALGTYKVTLCRTARYDWGTITFNKPGAVYRDVQVSGASILGVVVDGLTGKPLEGRLGYVCVNVRPASNKYFSSDIDERGRYGLAGLPAGNYRLEAHVFDRLSGHVSGVEIDEGEEKDNVRIKVTSGGTLLIKLSGFKKEENSSFKVYMAKSGEQRSFYGCQHIDKAGNCALVYPMEPGSYVVSLSWEDRLYVEREFKIFQGCDTEMKIQRNDLIPLEGFITVSGRLHHPDGTPVSKARLHFFAFEVPGIEQDQRSLYCTTDSSGNFLAEGFKPGRWWVRGNLFDGGEPVFPDIYIPPFPVDPFPLDLILPWGAVNGKLYDNQTGLPFTENGPTWWVFLEDAETGMTVSELQGGNRGREFKLDGLPEGKFDLVVSARGYSRHHSGKFSLSEGQNMDMGMIGLEPCGVLMLDVKDELGQRVEHFKVYYEENLVSYYFGESANQSFWRYYDLPLGTATVEVIADGYKNETIFINLEYGQTKEMNVVLKPE